MSVQQCWKMSSGFMSCPLVTVTRHFRGGYFRDPKDQGEIKVTWVTMVREDRKDIVGSLACRVFLDLQYVHVVLTRSP